METVVVYITQATETVTANITQVAETVTARIDDSREKKEFRHLFASPYDYVGKAIKGSADNAAVWKISRTEYNTAGELVAKRIVWNAKWSDLLTINF